MTNRSDAASPENLIHSGLSILQHLTSATLSYLTGISQYTNSFYLPYLVATHYFQRVEANRVLSEPLADSMAAYMGLLDNNIELTTRSLSGTGRASIRGARAPSGQGARW